MGSNPNADFYIFFHHRHHNLECHLEDIYIGTLLALSEYLFLVSKVESVWNPHWFGIRATSLNKTSIRCRTISSYLYLYPSTPLPLSFWLNSSHALFAFDHPWHYDIIPFEQLHLCSQSPHPSLRREKILDKQGVNYHSESFLKSHWELGSVLSLRSTLRNRLWPTAPANHSASVSNHDHSSQGRVPSQAVQ